MKVNGKITGYALGVLAAATYGMNPVFAVPLYREGMNADSVLLWRYALAIPIVGAMLLARGRSLATPRRDVPMLAAMGLLMALSSLTLFASYNYMNAGIASTLLFVYPVMVAVIMAIRFRERMSPVAIMAMALALTGIGLLYKNPSGATLSLTGTLLVMVSSLSYAVYIVSVNHSRLKDVPTLKITFYVLVFGTLLFAGRFAGGVELHMPQTAAQWANVAGLALFPTAISFICTTRAIHIIGSTPTAILGAFEPVTAIILGMTVLGQPISGREWAGIVLILVAVTAVIAAVPIAAHLTRLRRMFPRIMARKPRQTSEGNRKRTSEGNRKQSGAGNRGNRG